MRMLKSLIVICLSISLVAISVVQAQSPVVINIDAATNRHPINPYIYGVAHATTAQLSDLNSPLNRSGGNNTSRYNWQLNSDNRGADWYFESIAYPSNVAGEVGDSFIANSRAASAQPMLTIPMVGWVAKLGAGRNKLSSFSIAKYGAQADADWQWFPDAGNGVRTSGARVTNNDPNDANVPADSLFQQGWAQHLVSRWGTAAGGGLRYYILDNEPSIWHETHRDVHPLGATMDEVKNKMIDFASKIKTVDQSALVVGPEEWGWAGYLFSGYDLQYGDQHGWSFLPDRAAHQNQDYMPWLLDQLRRHDETTGQRLLDVFSVHYYPQGGEFSNDTSSSMQLRRNRSTRSLWDPNYTDESWINDKVKLIPRIKGWVNAYYPGTPVAITEYNWGAENHINGATAQADIFGIFGREGLDMAARWTTPAASTPTYKAMKMYRNYDGNKSTFGDTSVAATVPNTDNLSAFAALRSEDGALTVMAVNKISSSTTTTINLANFQSAGRAEVWQLTSSNQINRLADINFTGNSFNATLPGQSITLLVVRGAATTNTSPSAAATASPRSGIAPLAVAFDGRGSSDSDGSITSFAWSFGDGSTGSGATTSHTYSSPGNYVATLTVTDNAGASASTTVSITVSNDTSVINAPTNLKGSVSGRKVTLKWTDNSGNEQGFYIERAPKQTGVFARVAEVGANVRTFSQTVSASTYLYRVQAFNRTTGRVSAYSNQVQVRVK